jgi:redox-sensitive bicupin YhaK (pirin superfamily)
MSDVAVLNVRSIAHRGRGQTHGPITRLMSPGDLGAALKPFVFLDLFEMGRTPFNGFPLHPHSGIATLTYIADGFIHYEDTTGASGQLEAGGVEWMQAGGGVWHGGRPGEDVVTRGFQLWIALPPHLELGAASSSYLAASAVPAIGPVRVLLGEHAGLRSPIEAPSPINYLAVTLKAGEEWRYYPSAGHDVLWVALAKGSVAADRDVLEAGEIVAFEPGAGSVVFRAQTDAEFVLGSAAFHAHDLTLGYYSVHTSQAALAAGEAQIRDIRETLDPTRRLASNVA